MLTNVIVMDLLAGWHNSPVFDTIPTYCSSAPSIVPVEYSRLPAIVLAVESLGTDGD